LLSQGLSKSVGLRPLIREPVVVLLLRRRRLVRAAPAGRRLLLRRNDGRSGEQNYCGSVGKGLQEFGGHG
jgi:hypothetical protein